MKTFLKLCSDLKNENVLNYRLVNHYLQWNKGKFQKFKSGNWYSWAHGGTERCC